VSSERQRNQELLFDSLQPMATPATPLRFEEVTNPAELARADALRKQFDRNFAWLQAHVSEVYARHRGKFICVAGAQLFVADTAREAMALAARAHPEDKGLFFRHIPPQKLPRIYANRR